MRGSRDWGNLEAAKLTKNKINPAEILQKILMCFCYSCNFLSLQTEPHQVFTLVFASDLIRSLLHLFLRLTGDNVCCHRDCASRCASQRTPIYHHTFAEMKSLS